MSEYLPQGAGYLREGAAAGLWHLMTGDDVPDPDADERVIVAGGVQWSMYDVRAFRAFADHLRREPRMVFVVDLDDAVGQDVEKWLQLRFPRVVLPEESRYQPPLVVRYQAGAPDLHAFGHAACQVLADGG